MNCEQHTQTTDSCPYCEIEFLKNKLSPLENKSFTQGVLEAMAYADLRKYERDFRGSKHYVLTPLEMWGECFSDEPCNYDLTVLGRSLQALYWERSALNGNLVFVKKVSEHEQFGY